ncbi:glycine--tRNA ligase [Desulfurococcus amylolyticus]|uniref:glycine--tRNA ligase n=1 Tax=Desulfurococcus amylolyticus DSM 16532 TaxID=768672 RepID=I3XQ39_DESAM|nr:glycine--tRNA ligase [Desulfurococcus amylolyticus]AFL66063.1 glycyl-tRNA synthetase [Desulfurococcus amylolyticus DSM 16532]
MSNGEDIYGNIMELAKKRGIFWGSFDIYGGLAGFYDFGPVGVLLKRNLINLWLKTFVYSNDLVVEIETPMINPRIVFKASGHEESFMDPVVECLKCGRVYRADHLVKEAAGIDVEGLSPEEIHSVILRNSIKCPECGGDLGKPFYTLLLFKTEIGPYKGEIGYLRPENAQGMFINFANILRVARNRLPLGIAQVGKVARNEISPRQGLLRLREFTIMELEFFFDPEEVEEASRYINSIADVKVRVLTSEARLRGVEEPVEYTIRELVEKQIVKTPWLAYWIGLGEVFARRLGIPHEKIRFIEKLPHERAHYSQQTFDQEVYTEKYGWIEIAGYAYRTTYDLSRHIQYSKADLTFFKHYEKPVERIVPKAYPDPGKIKDLYGGEMGRIMERLAQKTPEEIYRELAEKGYVEVEGLKIPSEAFIVKQEREKIHGEKIIPHVVEPSFGVERLLYIVLEYSYTVRDGKTVLKLPVYLAPYHVAVFPLVTGKKQEHVRIVEIARNIYRRLIARGFRVIYDDDGSIGRRYARVDEIGIPYAVTVDYQTLEDDTVTVRDRDSTLQERVKIDELEKYLLMKYGFQPDLLTP